MRAFVGVTDIDWYRQLSRVSLHHDEVNFWFPSPRQGFRSLQVGEPFIFKTHVDRRQPELSNRLVGVGAFSGFARLRLSEAWDLFGVANGVNGPEELRRRIAHYRSEPIGRFEDPEIGAVILNDVTFFPPHDTIAAPDDFAANIVRGRTYDLTSLPPDHSAVETWLRQRAADAGILSSETRGQPALVVPRIGQQAFKAVISENYSHRCAITGDRVRPVLEAAHILPVAAGGEHRVDNGLLLRSDVHTLFDRGYLSVDPKYRLAVSPALREQFGNGDWFYQRAGAQVAVPAHRKDRPNREFLEWHHEEVFLGA